MQDWKLKNNEEWNHYVQSYHSVKNVHRLQYSVNKKQIKWQTSDKEVDTGQI